MAGGLSDDVLYVALLLASIGYGWVTTQPFLLRRPELRKAVSTAGGLTVILLVSGPGHTLHPLLSIAAQCLILKAVPWRHVHWLSFLVGFAHLFLFRSCGMWAWLPPAPPAHTNAIQMILTLKMIGVAFEYRDSVVNKAKAKGQRSDDSEEKKEEEEQLQLEIEYRSVDPSALDLFHYGLSHAGVLTGPYFRFRTFQDMYEARWSYEVDRKAALLNRLRPVPVYVALFLLSGWLFPMEPVKSSEAFYTETSWLYRLFYMTPVFFNFRMRLFSGFVLSECACIMAGLGAYPSESVPKPGQGPSDLKILKEIGERKKDEPLMINFEAMHNIDEYRVETVTTMREALKTWNMTVQWWLASNVYRRLSLSRSLRTVVVMVTSSAWHGVYAGYYLSLGSVPLVLPVEDLYEKLIRKRLSEKPLLVKAYDLLAWFMRFQWFSYLGMGFQLLRVDYTLKFWHSIGYIGHLTLPVFYLLGLTVVKPLVNAILPKPKIDDKKTS